MNYKKEIIALLFIWGEPLEDQEIAKAIGRPLGETRKYLQECQEEFNFLDLGLVMKKIGTSYQLQTDEDVYPVIEQLVSKQKNLRLNKASMETLTIIAYKQPITRLEVENLRGVNSTSTIANLEKKGFIEEAGRLDRIGQPILYRTTSKFLQAFQLESLGDLPKKEEKEEKHEIK